MNKAVFGSRKSIFEKYFIFRKCYFSERKMFLCVWLYFKKFFEKYFLVFGKYYKEKDKTRKTNTAPRLTLNARLGSTAQCFASSSPTTALSIAISRSVDRDRREGEMAIDGAISRSVNCDLAKHRADCDRREGEFAISDRDRRRWCLRTAPIGAWCVQTARTGYVSPSLARSLSLSLSLSLRNSFEVKIGTEIHFRSQSLFFWVNGNQFPENSIFRTNQTPAFPKKYFRK